MIPDENQNTIEEIEKHLTTLFHLNIYEELTEGKEAGLFEPLNFFKLYTEAFDIIIRDVCKPLTVLKKLRSLIDSYPLESKLYFYITLEKKMENHIEDNQLQDDDSIGVCLSIIYAETSKIEDEIKILSPPNQENNKSKEFNWQKVKEKISQIPDIQSQIILISDISAECEQYSLDDFIPNKEKYECKIFVEKCRIEIDRLKNNLNTMLLEGTTPMATNPLVMRLSGAKGVKIDFIRVINALYELRFFKDDKDQVPNKEMVMKKFGQLVGLDFSTYDTNLSQAINSGNVETNIAIFQKMSEKTQKVILNKNSLKR
jgi:hypothetical protein